MKDVLFSLLVILGSFLELVFVFVAYGIFIGIILTALGMPIYIIIYLISLLF